MVLLIVVVLTVVVLTWCCLPSVAGRRGVGRCVVLFGVAGRGVIDVGVARVTTNSPF